MNLSFKEYWPDNTPTWFVDKILFGLLKDKIINADWHLSMMLKYKNKFKRSLICNEKKKILPKITSIREDKTNRWKLGNNIHFIINNRTPNRFQFAPVVKLVSTQKIEINYIDKPFKEVDVYIDWRFIYSTYTDIYLHSNLMHQIAINDGFDSIEQFFNWFNKDFTGKIIHWTDLKY